MEKTKGWVIVNAGFTKQMVKRINVVQGRNSALEQAVDEMMKGLKIEEKNRQYVQLVISSCYYFGKKDAKREMLNHLLINPISVREEVV